jgi:2-iminobutanoate/2-iminopropanoate deaminase
MSSKGAKNMKTISTPNAPAAIGPYSQAKVTGNLLFTSGQIPINPATSQIEATTIEAQTEQVCKNIGAVLEAAGTSFDNVIKTVCFLADIKDFAAFNAVYAKYFVTNPARSCVAVKDLPKGALVEVETIAEI